MLSQLSLAKMWSSHLLHHSKQQFLIVDRDRAIKICRNGMTVWIQSAMQHFFAIALWLIIQIFLHISMLQLPLNN